MIRPRSLGRRPIWGDSTRGKGPRALTHRSPARRALAATAITSGPSLGLTIFSWNLLFGVGAIVIGSLVGIGRFSLGYLAPWWWALGYGVALGTNSFVLTVPGAKYAPQLDVLWSHVGGREIFAYLLIAAALANVHVWRPRRWHDLTLSRVKTLRDVRLSTAELACLAGALTLLAWTASVEAAGVAAFLR